MKSIYQIPTETNLFALKDYEENDLDLLATTFIKISVISQTITKSTTKFSLDKQP